MKEKHPIDSFFKEKLADRQYPMKEEYWSAAADLIEAQGGRKRRRFLWLFLLIGLLITGSTIGYYFSLDTAESHSPHSEITSLREAYPSEGIPEEDLANKGNERSEAEGLDLKSEHSVTPSFVSPTETFAKPSTLAKNKIVKVKEEMEEMTKEPANSEYSQRVLDALNLEAASLKAGKEDRGVKLALKNKAQDITYNARTLDERAFEFEEQEQANPSLRYPSKAARRKHQLWIDLGFAVNQGIKDPAASGQSIGMSPVIGISYRRRFNAQLEFTTALRYTQMPALAGDSTFLSTDFSFGAQVEGINIKALSLHQAEIPLQLGWYLGPRSKISGGAYFRYLINVHSEVSRFESNPFESTPGPVNRAWGYKQGFSDFDYGLQLGYFYHLSEGLEIGLETQYGLKDVRDNAFYRINSFDRNLNARIILRYHFLN